LHSALIDLFVCYKDISKLAVEPSGSYISYSQKKRELESEFSRKLARLENGFEWPPLVKEGLKLKSQLLNN